MEPSSKRSPNGTDSLNLVLFGPASDWTPPTEFPDLRDATIIGIDTETRDPHLTSRGPGFIRGDAEVVGISISTLDKSWYFPIGHLGGGNMDRDSVCAYLKDLLKRPDLTVAGANLAYDIESLDSLGIRIAGRHMDIQVAEGLIDEERESYSLESISQRYLGVGKDERLLREAASAYAVDPKSELWKLHSKYVGPYAGSDASHALRILQQQLTIMGNDGLLDIFQLESELLPVIFKMRKQGIRVDLDAARELSESISCEESDIRASLRSNYGLTDEWSGLLIARVCDRRGIKYPKTNRGNPSFTSEFLADSQHDLFQNVHKLRELNRLRKVFIDDWVFSNQINGRVHPVWRQMIKDDGGTRTGRMAAANPNPQQIPSKSQYSKKLRSLFIPEDGKLWAKLDYSQQEPRILVHFASLTKMTGAELIRLAYTNNRNMDIYSFLSESCGMSRRDAKDATLGRCYGMGVRRFAERQGLAISEAEQKLHEFDNSVPFVKEIAEYCMNLADRRGWIKTLCGRKRHFNYWEPCTAFEMRKNGEDVTPRREAEARIQWPDNALRRAFTHKALNSLIQGSAADMTKQAMLSVHNELGLVPHMQVHDELNYSVESEEQAREIQRICETCVEMTVPIKSDLSIGKHWK